jgi:alkylated DNA repair dioxygenase AlkB
MSISTAAAVAAAAAPTAPAARIEAIPSSDSLGDSVFIEIPNFLSAEDIALYESLLISTHDWKAGEFITGKTPRLQKWFQDDARYFSKHWNNQDLERWKSSAADAWLVDLRSRIQKAINTLFETQIDGVYTGCRRPEFNSTLINYYRDGNDYIRYHKDDEKVFGDNPTIAMLTFGCPRDLKFKWTMTPKDRTSATFSTMHHENDKSYCVEPGTLFLMAGSVQKCYWHGVERDPSITDSRFSLTFREHVDCA